MLRVLLKKMLAFHDLPARDNKRNNSIASMICDITKMANTVIKAASSSLVNDPLAVSMGTTPGTDGNPLN